MATLQRDTIEALITAITNAVAGAPDWEFHRFEPLTHPGNGDHCAVFFAGETVNEEGGSSGHQDIREEYHIEFWRPQPSGVMAVIDETDDLALEGIYDDVKELIYANEDTMGVYDFQFSAGAPAKGGEAETKLIGFEIVCVGKRTRHFT